MVPKKSVSRSFIDEKIDIHEIAISTEEKQTDLFSRCPIKEIGRGNNVPQNHASSTPGVPWTLADILSEI